MKPWRVVLIGLIAGGIAAGFVTGPSFLRFVLFWLFFFAVPGPLALRFLNVQNGWAYVATGAASCLLGLAGASYPAQPWQAGILDAALIGAMFGLGWKLLLYVADQTRGEHHHATAKP